MANEEEIMSLYEQSIVGEMALRLQGMELVLAHKLKTATDEDILEYVIEMNAILEFMTEGNIKIYEQGKYRLFRDIDDKLFVVQGEELDVDSDPSEYESPNEE